MGVSATQKRDLGTVEGAKKDLDSIRFTTKSTEVQDTPRGAIVLLGYHSPKLTLSPPFIKPELIGSVFSSRDYTSVSKTGKDGYVCTDYNHDSKFDVCNRTDSEGNQVIENSNGKYVIRESLTLEKLSELQGKLNFGDSDSVTEKYRVE